MNDAADRRPLRERALIALATGAAFVLFAWVAAHWLWRWASPPPPKAGVTAPADPAATILASGLWAGGDAPATAAPSAPGDLRLVGVLAERDGKGYAVFRTREGARVVAAGAEVAPGVRVAAVESWSVRLTDASGERTLALRRDAPPPAPSAPARAPVGGVAPKVAVVTPRASSPACAAPRDFNGAMLRLHAELLDGLIAQPESWRGLLAADNGQLVVREDGGFASMLGLAKGDRLVQANGIALQQPDDVIGAVLRPLAQSQPVRIAGSRAGQAREVMIVNATTCP